MNQMWIRFIPTPYGQASYTFVSSLLKSGFADTGVSSQTSLTYPQSDLLLCVLHVIQERIMAMLTLRLSDELNERLDWLAQRSGRTKSHFVKKMIAQSIEDMEDQVLGELAIKELLAGPPEDRETVPWEQVKAELREQELADRSNAKSNKRSKESRSGTKKSSNTKN
jgi:RHH-type rel operon transcriptional repressor/antitoxin RelB